MKKLFTLVSILIAGLLFVSNSYAGNGRGAMDGTGPISITSGCQGAPGTAQPGSGNQMRHGQRNGINSQGQGFGRK